MTPEKTPVLRVRVFRICHPFVVEDVRFRHRQLCVQSGHCPGNHHQFGQNRRGENLDRRLTARRAFTSLHVWRWFVCLEIDRIARRQRYIFGLKHEDIREGSAIESLADRAMAEDTEQRLTIRLEARSATSANKFHEILDRPPVQHDRAAAHGHIQPVSGLVVQPENQRSDHRENETEDHERHEEDTHRVNEPREHRVSKNGAILRRKARRYEEKEPKPPSQSY